MSPLPSTTVRTVAIVLAVAIGVGWYVLRDRFDEAGANAPGTDAEAGGEVRVARRPGNRVVVHVAGAVRRPGLVRVRDSARVADAVKAAGGATRRADLGGLNLAAKVEDGRQVVVPVRASAGGAAAGDAGAGPGGAAGAGAAPVNLNTATLEQLDALDGVGPGIAQRILDYRSEHGGFASIDELGEVSGIGEKRLEALREQVRL